MYEKLARGHATAYINDLQDYAAFVKWREGSRPKKLISAFERSSYSKKPGRALKRLIPHLRPYFPRPMVSHWSRDFKVVTATNVASTTENHVFRLPDDTNPLYSERAAFLAELWLSQDCEAIELGMFVCASISHHAIARLLERGAVSPEALSMELSLMLEACSVLAEKALLYAGIDHSAMQSLMLPYKRGALVAVFMDMDPARVHKGQKRCRILSVRSWLDESMLSGFDIGRMGGVDDLTRVMLLDLEMGKAGFLRWFEGNARPWSFADSTLEGCVRREE